MTSTVEQTVFDDEDSNDPTHADIGNVHPNMVFCNPPKYYNPSSGCGTSSTIYYCYYKAESSNPIIVG